MIKKGDFIELDYTAKLKDDKLIFDTTSADVARATGNFNSKIKYEPVVICVGEHHLIPGLDDALVGKNVGKYTIEVPAEKGFGKKRADFLKLIPLRLFQKDQVQPHPGLEVNVDGQVGMVKSVSGGRVIVDFNHPLSGKDLVYDVDVKRIVTDAAEQIRAVLELIHLPHVGIDIEESKAVVALKDQLPEEIAKELSGDLQRMTGLKEISFATVQKKEPDSKAEHSHEHHEHEHSHGHAHEHKHN